MTINQRKLADALYDELMKTDFQFYGESEERKTEIVKILLKRLKYKSP